MRGKLFSWAVKTAVRSGSRAVRSNGSEFLKWVFAGFVGQQAYNYWNRK